MLDSRSARPSRFAGFIAQTYVERAPFEKPLTVPKTVDGMNAGAPLPGRRGLSLAERLLIIVTILGILHHIDHVLRWDHSGWPFKPQVTPFTYSLLVYPLLLAIFALRSRPWTRVVIMGIVFAAVQFAHIFAETPHQQYYTWAAGVSGFADSAGHPNLLHVASPMLGIVAVTVSIALSIAMLAAFIALTAEARHGSLNRSTA